MSYLYHLIIFISIYGILALSLNLIVGYCGLLTMAHAAYFATGGYAYALATWSLGCGFIPAVAIAMTVTTILSFALSLPSWKFRGEFFVLVSMCIQTFIFTLLYNWSDPAFPVASWQNLTNGPFGIAGIPKPQICGFTFDSIASFCALASFALFVSCMFFSILQRSPWGRALQCMRDDERAFRALGKDSQLLKLQVFAIACGFAGLAGTLYTSYVGYIDPSSGGLEESILMLCMVIVGGVGNFRGPLIGAVVLLIIPEALRFIHIPNSVAANLRLMIYGVLIVVMMHIRTQGLAGRYRQK